ncbi:MULTISPECIES: hypothetical protein [unclassified Crossiella]|uniref:hypothetical protein n=1 Tax=unclassified Crossiella TaxID=2620835 RepID=UPI001FFE79B3|nr:MULTISPECIES: hypothetical protein [unclassified Crossiella]MCK2237152.1 hypothetical protein [Crossiella sp. S99.2]MCK2250820.1 hypothetical protein [Crossiella sp. S99.1]
MELFVPTVTKSVADRLIRGVHAGLTGLWTLYEAAGAAHAHLVVADSNYDDLAPPLSWDQVEHVYDAAWADCNPNSKRRKPAGATVEPQGHSGMLPVPPAEGDRQLSESDSPLAGELKELARHFAAGKQQDAAVILHYFGTTAPAKETAAAITYCHAQNLGDAASYLIEYSAQRPEKEVLIIVRSLNQSGQRDLADNLLALTEE